MPSAANPLRFPADWDVIRIGGVVSPGVCRVGKASRKHQWDVKRGKGALGSSITYQGIEPAKFTVDFDLWRDPYAFGPSSDPADFDLWDAYVPLFRYDPTKKTIQAVEIYHPSLAQIGIHSVVIEEVGNLVKKSEGSWIWTVQVAFLEYLPPPQSSAVQNPAGSKTNASSNPKTQPTPPLDAQALLQQLQAQAQSPDG